jgi:hypothetical protein
VRGGATEAGEGVAEEGGGLVAHDQRRPEGVADRADTDLDRATVRDEGGAAQADCMVGGGYGHVRWREEREVVTGEEEVEGRGGEGGGAGHERELGVGLADEECAPAAEAEGVEDVEGDVAVAGDAEAVAFGRNELGEDVDAALEQVAGGVGVVGGDVAALCRAVAEPAAGLEKEHRLPPPAMQRDPPLRAARHEGAPQRSQAVARNVPARAPWHSRRWR